jgi:hypothetical protein
MDVPHLLAIAAATAFAAVLRSGGAAATGPAADFARLRRHVDALVSSDVGPRDIDHPEGLDRAAAYIEAALRQHAGDVSVQPFSVDGARYRNVIARFGARGGERIVVGAHYDTAGPLRLRPRGRRRHRGARGGARVRRGLIDESSDRDTRGLCRRPWVATPRRGGPSTAATASRGSPRRRCPPITRS